MVRLKADTTYFATVRLKADTTYFADGPPEGGHYVLSEPEQHPHLHRPVARFGQDLPEVAPRHVGDRGVQVGVVQPVVGFETELRSHAVAHLEALDQHERRIPSSGREQRVPR